MPDLPIDLDRVARRVRLALELVSDTSAASLGQHVKSGRPEDKTLHLVEQPPHIWFWRRYTHSHTEQTKRLVITEGLNELRALRYAKHPSVDCQTLDGRLTVGRDTRPAHIVAHAYGYTTRHVHRLRAEARKHDERTGKRAA